MSKIYLAIPYSFNPNVSYEIANRVAAILMQHGNIVFSPISHSHSIADHLSEQTRLDHEFWMNQDLPMVEWADKVVVVMPELYAQQNGVPCGEELVRDSRGVQAEITHAKSLGKKVDFVHYSLLGNQYMFEKQEA